MNLTDNEVKNFFSYQIFNKGEIEYKEGRVIDLQVKNETEDGVEIKSVVKSDNNIPYNQHIFIDNAMGFMEIEYSCSCSHKNINYCSHMISSILFFINNIKNQLSLTNLDIWMNNLLEASKDVNYDNNESETKNYILYYKLYANAYTNALKLSFFKIKILKSGKMSRGQKLDQDKVLYYKDYDFLLNKEDNIIINSYKELLLINKETDNKIVGKLGYSLISQLLKTQRCLYENYKNILYFNKTKVSIHFNWELIDNSYYILDFNIKNKYYIIPTEPILLIEYKNFHIAELDNEYSIKILDSLIQTPQIQKEKLFQVYSNILKKNPMVKLPMPKNFKHSIVKKTPYPKLLFFQNNFNGVVCYYIKLTFIYNEVEVSFYSLNKQISIFKDSTKIDILREYSFEEETIDFIKNFNFVSTVRNRDIIFSSPVEATQQNVLNQWSSFLSKIDKLKMKNWQIEYHTNFKINFSKSNNIIVESSVKNNSFSLLFYIEINDEKIALLPLIASILRDYDSIVELPEVLNLERKDNSFIQIETIKIHSILKIIFELYSSNRIKKESLEILNYEAHMVQIKEENIEWKGDMEILELSKKVSEFTSLKQIKPSKYLRASLRDYQVEGISWLNFLYEFKFSGILADDMGLGKTLQTLAFLQVLKDKNLLTKPTLIILPTSLISNWKNEINKFTPNLTYLSLYGKDRFDNFKLLKQFNIIITTYLLVIKDEKFYNKEDFLYIILDEAQKIKNHKTKMAISIKKLKSDYRLSLSGTPIENNLGELWSIYSFLMPGFLDTNIFFKKYYQNPIEKQFNKERQKTLYDKIRPFLLRRTKENVIKELPAKTEIIKYVQFDTKQSQLYKSIRTITEKKVRDIIIEKGIDVSKITILDALLKLRQICCHPKLLKLKNIEEVTVSAKLDCLLGLLEELLAENKKILIFSQFTSMLNIIEEEFKKRNYKYTMLVGSTMKREEKIEEFTSGKSDIFLISLKAGGIGLNLVEADTIIHYDPWWNPAIEKQATDRAHRIGQTKAIFIYKLIVEGSIEEKILELQSSKKHLQDILDENTNINSSIGAKELMKLLS